jgi:hypothetical protein
LACIAHSWAVATWPSTSDSPRIIESSPAATAQRCRAPECSRGYIRKDVFGRELSKSDQHIGEQGRNIGESNGGIVPRCIELGSVTGRDQSQLAIPADRSSLSRAFSRAERTSSSQKRVARARQAVRCDDLGRHRQAAFGPLLLGPNVGFAPPGPLFGEVPGGGT